MGLAIILGLARRLTFQNYSFMAPLHSSFMTFRFMLGRGGEEHADGFRERMMKAGTLPGVFFFSLSGQEPVGRMSPGHGGITQTLPERSGVILPARETPTPVTSVTHCADNSSFIRRY